jgi:hypothetical protein
MKLKVNQVREINLIEKELNKTKVGILAYHDDKDKVIQVVTPFVYVNKNIYLFYENNENYNRIVLNDSVNFSIYKEEKITRENVLDFEPVYKFLQIWCGGIIKKVDESKLAEVVIKAYHQKYTSKPEKGKKELDILFVVDTDEIQAAEMFGE